MVIGDIFDILKKPEISFYFKAMAEVHVYTKHYLLIAEELSEEGVAFLQPLKEHRDAYDHINRIYALSLKEDSDDFHVEAYILDNVKKAFGHEYRAFFDMADWLTYIARKYIREALLRKNVRKKYEEKFDFGKTQEFINQLPFEIARFREEKDISNKKSTLKEVLEYKDILDELLEIYRQVQEISI